MGLGVEARVTRPVFPLRFPIDKPPPARPAPSEATPEEWSWDLGRALPNYLSEACALWSRLSESQLVQVGLDWEERGFQVANEPLVLAWNRTLEQHSSAEYKIWARFYLAAFRLSELGVAAKAKR
eukprot:6003092-Pyramimonas_sp.AAC.1